MDKIKEYAKSIATFLATIGINMVISLLQGEQPFPHTQEEWIRYLGTAFTAALATGVARNKMTQKQVDTAIVKGDLGPPTQVPVGTTPAVWTQPPMAYQSTTEGTYPVQPMEPEPPTSPASELSVIDQIIAEKRR